MTAILGNLEFWRDQLNFDSKMSLPLCNFKFLHPSIYSLCCSSRPRKNQTLCYKTTSQCDSMGNQPHLCVHLFFQTIYWDFPRLAGIPDDEWIPEVHLRHLLKNADGHGDVRSCCPLRPNSSSLCSTQTPLHMSDSTPFIFSLHQGTADGEPAKVSNSFFLFLKSVSS